ncbi:hypothetical protein [Larkinella soli]|uniref:hypothetical protein n=1 Tax=Larkinella soli TaxID=1770527 RepID=UPI000FFB8FF5|nr:hypothetical protein [Larkinella soli]
MKKQTKTKEQLQRQIEEAKAAEKQAQEQIRHWKKEENKNKVERLQREAELNELNDPDLEAGAEP